jgi:hypothetical protein
LLKFENYLVCAPCHHGKMIAASHSQVNTVMTEHPRQLLHMDTVGPSQVRSMGGKWYVLVIVDDYSRHSWVFFLESKDQVFEHFRLLTLRLNNEHPSCLKVIRSDNGADFINASFVAQGHSQVEGLDFGETFAPIPRLEAIRILLAFLASKGFKLYQMDVKSAFLNGVIQEEVYIRQPQVSRVPNTQIECTSF